MSSKSKWLVNKLGVLINPSTRDNQETNISLLTLVKDKIIQLLFHDGHLKVLGFHESIGHLSTNTDITVERAMGKKTGIGEGAFTLLEEAAFFVTHYLDSLPA